MFVHDKIKDVGGYLVLLLDIIHVERDTELLACWHVLNIWIWSAETPQT